MDHGPTTSPLTLPEAERRRRQGYYHQHCTLTEDVAWIWIWRRLTLKTQDVGGLGNWRYVVNILWVYTPYHTIHVWYICIYTYIYHTNQPFM